MKKKIFYGMIALLSVSLFFLACDTGTSSESATTTPAWPDNDGSTSGGGGGGNTAAQAQGVANILGGGATASGSIVTLPSTGGTLTTDVTVPAGVTLEVKGNYAVEGDLVVNGDLVVETGTFSVASGGTLTAAGNVSVPTTATVEVLAGGTLAMTGDVTVEGTINNTGDIEVSGEYTLDGASGTNNGTVTVKSGGVINSNPTSITGTGTNTVESGGTVYFAGNTSKAFIGDDTAVFQVQSGATFSYKNDSYVIAGGEVKVGKASTGDALTISSKQQVLTIKADGTLIIPKGGDGTFADLTLWNESNSGVPLVGEAGATVVMKSGAFVEFDTANNFYSDSSTLITLTNNNRDYKPTTDETYKWDASINNNVGGWLKQQ